jgi:phage terminase small subunit
MPRGRNPNIDKAERLYKEGNKLIDISNMLNIPEGTIRSWKNRYNWDEEDSKKNNATLQKDNNKKCNVAKEKCNKKSKEDKQIIEATREVLQNEELNENQKLFCIYYSKCFNQTKAYQQAYGADYMTAAVNANRLLKNAKIREMVDQLTQVTMNKELLKRGLLQKYIDIAFADIKDYMTFGTETVEGKHGEFEISVVKLKDSSNVDGTLISEVSQGKDGIKIKLVDKMKAMDFLSKHTNLLSDEEKTKLDNEYKKVQIQRLQKEIETLDKDSNANKEPVRIVDDI